jgi:2-phospho-L-lactate/phosphoenolpyruvate guanylyltransferase
MSAAAIIPVKPFDEGKSRLASVLADDQRQALIRNMFCHVLKTTLATPGIIDIIVISRDEEALGLAEEAGAHAILEAENSTLNAALDVARKASVALGASGLLVVPADLAKLDPTDLSAVLSSAEHQTSATNFVAIAPDETKHGTNALYIRPPESINFSFGTNSFEKHRNVAIEAGCNVHIIERPNLAFDVDEPDDLNNLEENFWRA